MFNSASHLYSSHEHDGRKTYAASQLAHPGHSASIAASANQTNHAVSSWTSTNAVGPVPSSLNEPFGQSRPVYQQGFIMSTSQSNAIPSTSPRFEEQPVVKTKAKINSSLARASTLEFGKDPMFESSVARGSDEDAPPITSVNDIASGVYIDPGPPRKSDSLESSFFNSARHISVHTPSMDPLYVIVFGYPLDKYALATEYFKQLGDATEPALIHELVNAFRIGYRLPADAMRAVRKNGEILGGSWVVGVKWEHPSQAEYILGHSSFQSNLLPPGLALQAAGDANPSPPPAVPRSPTASASAGYVPTLGTPFRLAPSAAAFRKPGTPIQKPSSPHRDATSATTAAATTPSRGVLGQFSDLVFGW